MGIIVICFEIENNDHIWNHGKKTHLAASATLRLLKHCYVLITRLPTWLWSKTLVLQVSHHSFCIVRESPSYWYITGTAQPHFRNTATCLRVVPFPHRTRSPSLWLISKLECVLNPKVCKWNLNSSIFSEIVFLCSTLNIHVKHKIFPIFRLKSQMSHLQIPPKKGKFMLPPRFHPHKCLKSIGFHMENPPFCHGPGRWVQVMTSAISSSVPQPPGRAMKASESSAIRAFLGDSPIDSSMMTIDYNDYNGHNDYIWLYMIIPLSK